jgi:FAD/FMN-containing dehydrogenase
VATNAGGLQVIRHGDTRRQLLGVEAVTGAGEIVGDLRGLHKDNTGYHLPSLLAGSEGTLAIITRVCVRLHPRPEETAVALLAFADPADAFGAVGPLRLGIADLHGLELFFADGLALVCDTFELAPPFTEAHAAYLLAEVAGTPGVVERFGGALEAIDVAVVDVAVGTTAAQQEALWRFREAHTEAINLRGVPHKLDVTLPLAAMVPTVGEIRRLVSSHAPDAETWIFGHAGDGNLHVNVTGVAPDDQALDKAILEVVAAAGGSISAEHGIGRAKAALLGLNRTPSEIALARRCKAAFDPAGILNPGVILP